MEMDFKVQSFDFDLWPFLWMVAICIGLYIVYSILTKILVPLFGGAKMNSGFANALPVVSRSLVGFLIISLCFALIKPNPVSGTVVVVILIGGSWFFAKNYIAGLYVLLSRDLRIGQNIRTGDYTGTIIELGTIYLTVELGKGELVNISYLDLLEQPIIKTTPSEKILSHLITLEFDKSEDLNTELARIRMNLAASPWLLPGNSPKIETKIETAENTVVQITLFGIDKKHLDKVEQSLRDIRQAS